VSSSEDLVGKTLTSVSKRRYGAVISTWFIIQGHGSQMNDGRTIGDVVFETCDDEIALTVNHLKQFKQLTSSVTGLVVHFINAARRIYEWEP